MMSQIEIESQIQIRLSNFKSDLHSLSIDDLFDKYILQSDCFALEQSKYDLLRAEISTKFSINIDDIAIVGSGRLGFSIAPDKIYKPFDDTSDIDVAVIAPMYFDDLWKQVHKYNSKGGYWEHFFPFRRYLYHGWIRPDFLPSSKTFEASNDWWEFFRSLTSSKNFGPYKIRGALYKDLYFLKSYQYMAISKCIDNED